MSKYFKLWLGPILAFISYGSLINVVGFDIAYTAALAVLMSSWWVLESIPLPVTALLPMVLFPLGDVASISKVAASYSHPVLGLFLGGFLLASGLEKWGLRWST